MAGLLLIASIQNQSIAKQRKECVSSEDAYQTIKKSTVLIVSLTKDNKTATGTGLVVDQKGTVITSTHVVENLNVIAVVDSDKNLYYYHGIEGGNPHSVTALIPNETFPKNYVPLKYNSTEIGDQLFSVGHPLGMEFTFSTGMVMYKYPDAIVTNVLSAPGSSGSAVFDCELHPVGFVYGINATQKGFTILNPVGDAIIEANKVK